MEMEENAEDSTDWISQFPECINHHIMSFLDSPKERVRMSVLSKSWFALTASFPILDFNIHEFPRLMDPSDDPLNYSVDNSTRNNFFKYVEYTTSRFCQQNVTTAHTFKLSTDQLEIPTEVEIAQRCLESILVKGVQVLAMNVKSAVSRSSSKPKYRVPNQLLSASSLTSLKLCGCELPLSLAVDPVKFNSLKLLHLERVYLEYEVIKCLTINCPLLEKLILTFCYGFKRFCVYGLQNLQKVQIEYSDETEIIDIEAPNLTHIQVANLGRSEAPSLNLALCKKLTTLYYYACTPLKSEVFSDFLSNAPFIRVLIMSLPGNCKRLKLSSSSLRILFLTINSDLDEIDINTPNLILLFLKDQVYPPYLVLRESLQPEAQMTFDSQVYVDSLWFRKLKQFLEQKNGFKVLNLHLSSRNFLDAEELKVIRSPPNELELIDLKLTDICGLSVYEAVVDAVLWCCCPRSLKLTSRFQTINSTERNQVVMFTYEKLLQQEDEGKINIQIVLSSSKAEKHFSDLNSLLTALPCVEQEHVITFVKEEDTQEEAG